MLTDTRANQQVVEKEKTTIPTQILLLAFQGSDYYPCRARSASSDVSISGVINLRDQSKAFSAYWIRILSSCIKQVIQFFNSECTMSKRGNSQTAAQSGVKLLTLVSRPVSQIKSVLKTCFAYSRKFVGEQVKPFIPGILWHRAQPLPLPWSN